MLKILLNKDIEKPIKVSWFIINLCYTMVEKGYKRAGTVSIKKINKSKLLGNISIYIGVNNREPNDIEETREDRLQWFEQCLNEIKTSEVSCVAFRFEQLNGSLWFDYITLIKEFSRTIKTYIVSSSEGMFPLMMPSDDDIKKHDVLWEAVFEKLKSNFHFDSQNTDENDTDENLTYQNTSLSEYTKNNIPKGWEDFFESQLDEYGSMTSISEFLSAEASSGKEIFPPLNLIYNAFNLVKPKDVKVVILGQDPYQTPGYAMGVSFSVMPGITIPKTLTNIYNELENDGYKCDRGSGDLTKWCKKGVLMINTTFTVESGISNSHKKQWEDFSTALMLWLNANLPPCVFVLWGTPAINAAKSISSKHKKVESTHPSPLGANKDSSKARAFTGSKPFHNINNALKSLKRETINWSL